MARARLNVETLASLRRVLDPSKTSRCVSSINYVPNEGDLSSGDLDVTFVGPPHGGAGTWRYFEVPINEYELFRDAASQGTYFNLYIRDQYSNERID